MALPRAGLGPCRSLLEVSTPPGVIVEGIPAGFEPASMVRTELGRAEGIAQSIRGILGQFDRSSGRDHERLVSLLINHELDLRSAERASRWSEPGRTRTADDATRDRIARARRAVSDAVTSAGLPDDLASAQGYLGDSTARVRRPPGGIPEPIALGRIRAFGQPTGMLGIVKGIDDPAQPAVLTLQDSSPGMFQDSPPDGMSLIMLLVLGAAMTGTLGSNSRAAVASAMAMVLGAAAFAGGPTGLAGGLGLAGFALYKNLAIGTGRIAGP